MTPLLLLAVVAASTTSGTIHPQATTAPKESAAMAQPNLSFPYRHPAVPGPGSYAAPGPAHRGAANQMNHNNERLGPHHIATMGNNLTPVEHTNRPR